jgi:murein DD-endopeptidase MepM/ murein hydrolase activator NlpD
MIRLKSLLTEQSSNKNELPNVLFIGDSNIDDKGSFARILLDKKVVRGRAITRSNELTSKSFLRLADKHIKSIYQSIVISFGDIGLKESADTVIENFQNVLDIITQSDIPVYVIYTDHGDIIKRMKNENQKENIRQIDNWVESLTGATIIRTDIKNINTPSENVRISKKLINDLGTNIDLDVDASIEKIESPETSSDQTDSKDTLDQFADKQQNRNDDSDKNDDMQGSMSLSSILKSSPLAMSSKISSIDINDDVVTQTSALLRHFEAFSGTPYWDVSNWRIGYGSSTVTTETGDVVRLSADRSTKPNVSITVEDAERDLKRRLETEFIPWTLKSINNTQLPNNVLAALVSIVYNYGHLPSSVQNAVKQTPLNLQGIADAVSALTSNTKRRKQEAAFILQSKSDNDITNNDNKNKPAGGNYQIKPISQEGEFTITSHFGIRKSGMHKGLDISARVGTTIYLKKSGTVIFAGNRNPDGWGNMVEIEHRDGSVTRYAHLSRIDVELKSYPAGTLIGLTGGAKGAAGAGNSRGPHLHWEWLPDGNTAKDGESVVTDYFSFSKTKEDSEDSDDDQFTLSKLIDKIF